ncbi:MAG: hypothetical protein QOE05_788 [Actinomycetota bacterium]|jgi:hypothetical protein|nr:hypothetical protein [Actinomycetota bacterium]
MADTAGGSTRIRISLSTGELEVSGSEAFVSQYAESIETLLERLQSQGPTVLPQHQLPNTGQAQAAPAPQHAAASGADEEPFGEVLHSLTSKTGTDQILLAGYYIGKGNPDGTFATGEAHAKLIEQGVKLSNASQSMKNNLVAKRVFKVGSRYKVSKQGVDHLKSLGSSAS